jgi:hypothetical protein
VQVRVVGVVAEQFERDTGGTLADWRGWLPPACHGHALTFTGPQQAQVQMGTGSLTLDWQALPPRRLGLAKLPHLLVRYRFEGVTEEERARFMRVFDLHMHRGGG